MTKLLHMTCIRKNYRPLLKLLRQDGFLTKNESDAKKNEEQSMVSLI